MTRLAATIPTQTKTRVATLPDARPDPWDWDEAYMRGRWPNHPDLDAMVALYRLAVSMRAPGRDRPADTITID
jgi:hypothetical protein